MTKRTCHIVPFNKMLHKVQYMRRYGCAQPKLVGILENLYLFLSPGLRHPQVTVNDKRRVGEWLEDMKCFLKSIFVSTLVRGGLVSSKTTGATTEYISKMY